MAALLPTQSRAASARVRDPSSRTLMLRESSSNTATYPRCSMSDEIERLGRIRQKPRRTNSAARDVANKTRSRRVLSAVTQAYVSEIGIAMTSATMTSVAIDCGAAKAKSPLL
jgi:hypothetical protein